MILGLGETPPFPHAPKPVPNLFWVQTPRASEEGTTSASTINILSNAREGGHSKILFDTEVNLANQFTNHAEARPDHKTHPIPITIGIAPNEIQGIH